MSWDKDDVRSCARQIGNFPCKTHYTSWLLLLVISKVSTEVVYLLRELYKKDGKHRKNLE